MLSEGLTTLSKITNDMPSLSILPAAADKEQTAAAHTFDGRDIGIVRRSSSLLSSDEEAAQSAATPRDLTRARQRPSSGKDSYKTSLARHESHMRQKQRHLTLAHQRSPEGVDDDVLVAAHKRAMQQKIQSAGKRGASGQQASKRDVIAARPPQREMSSLDLNEKQACLLQARLCDYAYKGIGVEPYNFPLPRGCRLVPDAALPPALRMFYNEETGILHPPGEAKALLVEKDDTLIVAFSGTELGSASASGRRKTVETDIRQFVGGSTKMYSEAAGIARLLLEHEDTAIADKPVLLTGHSLGGGLAQYALIANLAQDSGERLRVSGFNSAGLSSASLAALDRDRIDEAHSKTQMFRLSGDVISARTDSGMKHRGVSFGAVATVRPSRSYGHLEAHKSGNLAAEIYREIGAELGENPAPLTNDYPPS